MREMNTKFQTKINLLYNIITFVINALIGLVLPAYLIQKLGISTYSLIPISMSITSFMLVITVSINGTLSRFLSIDFVSELNDVNKTFSTSFLTLAAIFVLILPVSIFFLIDPNYFLNIELKDIYSARILFSTIIVAFVFNAFASLFNSIAYVKNRVDLRNIALIINRLGIIVFISILFFFGYIKVQAYGIAVLTSTVLSFLYSYYTARKLYPKLRIRISFFDRDKFKKLYALGFWLIINQIGVLLFLQTDILIVNKFLGASQSGVYGTIVQWSFLMRAVVGLISGILGPIILTLYAKEQINKLIELTQFSTKLLGLFSSLISITIIFFAKDILKVWIGEEFVQYAFLLQVMVFHLGFNLGFNSIINLNIAYNKARIPGIVTLVIGVLNVGMCILFLTWTNLGLTGIAIAAFIALTLKNLVFTPIYAAKIMAIDLFTYLKPIVPSVILIIIGVVVSCFFTTDNWSIDSYWQLLMYGAAFLSIFSLLIGGFFISAKERRLIKQVIFSKIK
ncbi:MAG: oligosaccharide flippase family protein [Psychroflexus sp.]